MQIPTRVILVLVVLAALGSSVSAQAVGQIPVWDGINLIGDSVITQNSDRSLSINVASPGAAVFVNNSAASGNTNGLSGYVGSPDGNGVFGNNYATSGFAVGVTGITFSPAGAGLNGSSAATSGGFGVIGTTPLLVRVSLEQIKYAAGVLVPGWQGLRAYSSLARAEPFSAARSAPLTQT